MSVKVLLLTAVLAVPALAHDAGRTVTFRGASSSGFDVSSRGAGGRVVYDSGESDRIPEDWDSVVIQGDSPDAAVVFEAARPATAPEAAPQWTRFEVHRQNDGRFWARVRLASGAGPVRLRALDTGSSADHRVEIYGVEAFLAGAERADETKAVQPAPLHAPNPAAVRPFVYGRQAWRAVKPAEPYTPDPVRWRVTLHHTDGRRTTTLAQSEAEARFIQDFHIHGRGWNDIAYHFLVDAAGNILEGRPESALGAHTLNNNDGNIGIVLLGTYHPPKNDVPTAKQLAAVAALGRYLVERYGLDPKSLKGHRDYRPTECPGNLAYADMDALRLAFGTLPKPPAFVDEIGEAAWDGAPRRP